MLAGSTLEAHCDGGGLNIPATKAATRQIDRFEVNGEGNFI